jgi:hypothetical protein
MASTPSYPIYVRTLINNVFALPSVQEEMKSAVAAHKERPLIFGVFLDNVAPLGGGAVSGGVNVKCSHVKTAAGKRQIFKLVPNLQTLADMGTECPAPILVRFEITFTNGKREFGVVTHTP